MARKGVQATLSLSDPSGAGLIYLTLHHDETIEDTTEKILREKVMTVVMLNLGKIEQCRDSAGH
jgi:C4-type Zn-finger protein